VTIEGKEGEAGEREREREREKDPLGKEVSIIIQPRFGS
jgi:hypothetical protein